MTYAVGILWEKKLLLFYAFKAKYIQAFHVVLQLEELKKSHTAATSRETIDDESSKDDEVSVQSHFTQSYTK